MRAERSDRFRGGLGIDAVEPWRQTMAFARLSALQAEWGNGSGTGRWRTGSSGRGTGGDERKRVVYEPVRLAQQFRQFDFLSPWEGADYVLPGDEKAKPQ